jgi:hypothetical protein
MVKEIIFNPLLGVVAITAGREPLYALDPCQKSTAPFPQATLGNSPFSASHPIHVAQFY